MEFIAGRRHTPLANFSELAAERRREKLSIGTSAHPDFWVDASSAAGDIAFTGSTPAQPSELYYMASATDVPSASPISIRKSAARAEQSAKV
jgi:hypothetical protein